MPSAMLAPDVAGRMELPAASVVRTVHGPIEFADTGHGPAILVLHGTLGGYDQSLILARAALAEIGRYRVLAVSRPGYLGTPLTSGRTPAAQADLLAALIDPLHIPAATVLASSGAGPTALQFALRHPARCTGLVMIATCTGHHEEPAWQMTRLRVGHALGRLPGFAAIMRRRLLRDPDEAARRAIADDGQRRAAMDHPRAGPLLRAEQANARRAIERRLPGTINDFTQFRRARDYPLEKVRAPTLVVHGTADRSIPFSHAEAVAGRVPGAELLALTDAGHAGLFSHFDLVRTRIAGFLASPAFAS